MATKTILFEDGTSDGAAQTTTNTGASQVTTNTGTATFSTATKSNGTYGGRWVSGSNLCISRFTATANNNNMVFEGVCTVPTALGTSAIGLMTLRHTSGPSLVFELNQGGMFTIYNPALSSSSMLTTDGTAATGAAYTPTLGSQYRISIVAAGGSTTTASYTVKVYTRTGTTPLAYRTFTGSNLNANMLAAIDLGVTSTSAPTGTVVGWDDVRLIDGGTTEPGPLVTATPLATPVVTMAKTEPTVYGGTDGSFTATWPAVSGAGSYKVSTPPLAGSVTSGTPTTTTITATTYTWTAQPAGTQTVTVQAIPA